MSPVVVYLLPEADTVIEVSIDFAPRPTIADLVRECVEEVGVRGVWQELQV